MMMAGRTLRLVRSVNGIGSRTTSFREQFIENVVVRGISIERNQAKVTITNVPDKPGTASRIFTALAEANMSIDVIVQIVSVSGTVAVDADFGTGTRRVSTPTPKMHKL